MEVSSSADWPSRALSHRAGDVEVVCGHVQDPECKMESPLVEDCVVLGQGTKQLVEEEREHMHEKLKVSKIGAKEAWRQNAGLGLSYNKEDREAFFTAKEVQIRAFERGSAMREKLVRS